MREHTRCDGHTLNVKMIRPRRKGIIKRVRVSSLHKQLDSPDAKVGKRIRIGDRLELCASIMTKEEKGIKIPHTLEGKGKGVKSSHMILTLNFGVAHIHQEEMKLI